MGRDAILSTFKEKIGENEGQRRKRFLEHIRAIPMPDATWDEKQKKWIPNWKKKGSTK